MKKKGMIVLLIVLIVAAMFLVRKQTRPVQYVRERVLVDTQENKLFIFKIPAGQIFEYPAESPFSEGKNAYPAYECMDCGAIFGVSETTLPADTDIKCPVCGSVMLSSAILPEGQESADVPGEPVKVVK
ncbi:MAG: hypothetical protein JW957_04145 [Candidatus Omnitrophica bacterium]|nr:hypothetical protein [Candidatus Omnitrophota bacterium]